MASALDLSQNVRPSNTNLQNVVSFWETSSARPLPVLCPWTLLGDLHPQTSWLPPLQNSKYANTEKLSLCNWLLEAVIESGFLWWVQLFHSYAVLSVLAEVICLKCRELCTMKSVYQLAYLTHIHWQNVLTVYSGFSNDYYWLLRMCLICYTDQLLLNCTNSLQSVTIPLSIPFLFISVVSTCPSDFICRTWVPGGGIFQPAFHWLLIDFTVCALKC